MVDNVFVRLIVAIIVAAVIVWLLGMTTIPTIIVALSALLGFFAVFFGAAHYSRPI